VSRKGALSFFAPGLGEELWRKNTSAWVVQLSLGCDIVYGPAQGVVRRYDAAGKVVAEVHASGLLQAVDEACVVAWVDGELVATEWSGRVRWRRKTLASHVLLDGERTFVVENLGCRLVCLESASGAERWELKAPENRRQPTGWFLSGFPSVAIARGELVVIGRDGSVQLVDRASGEVRAMTMPPYVGSFLVSETAVYFFRLAGWSQLDLATLSETARQEYVADVAHMQGRVLPAAFWISEESVFWTTLGGQVMGVSRFADEGGRRVWWSDEVRGILAIAEPPVHVGRHLYVRTRGSQGSAGELICYKSV
jgi:outer membrane protein assembly factor BamB